MADQASVPLRRLVESRRDQVMAIASRHHASRVRLPILMLTAAYEVTAAVTRLQALPSGWPT